MHFTLVINFSKQHSSNVSNYFSKHKISLRRYRHLHTSPKLIPKPNFNFNLNPISNHSSLPVATSADPHIRFLPLSLLCTLIRIPGRAMKFRPVQSSSVFCFYQKLPQKFGMRATTNL